jgi:GTP-binding protein
LVLIVDMAGTDARDPRDDYKHLLEELELYDPELLKKPRVVVANKLDQDDAKTWLPKFKRRYSKVDVLEISCLTGAGLEKLKLELRKRVIKLRALEKKQAKVAAAATAE